MLCARAPEADALLRLGLLEGSPNTHPGQGTENRRFFFENGYLELLWVFNPNDAQSPLTRRTRLWERWSQRATGACPFGIAFRPAGPRVEEPPFRSWPYVPAYLPNGLSIQFAEGTSLQEPELFYLAWPSRFSNSVSQPTAHAVPLRAVTSIVVGVPDVRALSDPCAKGRIGRPAFFQTSCRARLGAGIYNRDGSHVRLGPVLPVVLKSSAAHVA